MFRVWGFGVRLQGLGVIDDRFAAVSHFGLQNGSCHY